MEPLLELKKISKSFPGTLALSDVSFQLQKNEIHALMGENGAGKSTFIKVITGCHQADKGNIFLKGKSVTFTRPLDAQLAGISAVYQHGATYPELSATENIFVGHEITSKTMQLLQWKRMHEEARQLLSGLGSDLDPRSVVKNLSIAQQQIIEIAKALSLKAEILILDEPTAALSKSESQHLYELCEQLRQEGVSLIFVSHRLEDIYSLADRVSVLRDGCHVGTWLASKLPENDLIRHMVGREIDQLYPLSKKEITGEVLRVEDFSKTGFFRNISLRLHKGEILGLTGLVGAGRSELCQAIMGIIPHDGGRIYLHDEEIHLKNPSEAFQLGIGYLPEDRQQQGLFLNWSILNNIVLKFLKKPFQKMEKKKELSQVKELRQKLQIKMRDEYQLVKDLSGGNQQKVVFAKLLNVDLSILIFDEPTKGVDINAKASIHKIIASLAEQGYAIIIISSEMPEVMGMADRLLVMRKGSITLELSRENFDADTILRASL